MRPVTLAIDEATRGRAGGSSPAVAAARRRVGEVVNEFDRGGRASRTLYGADALLSRLDELTAGASSATPTGRLLADARDAARAAVLAQAELTLEGVPERWAATGKDPVAAAAAEVEKRWYTAASLEVSGGRAAWRAECADGTVRTSECELTHGTTVDKWLHETGIER